MRGVSITSYDHEMEVPHLRRLNRTLVRPAMKTRRKSELSTMLRLDSSQPLLLYDLWHPTRFHTHICTPNPRTQTSFVPPWLQPFAQQLDLYSNFEVFCLRLSRTPAFRCQSEEYSLTTYVLVWACGESELSIAIFKH